jgi:hypothetical protein
MTSFSATESTQKTSDKIQIKKRNKLLLTTKKEGSAAFFVYWLLRLPDMYAQAPTIATVRTAPANPEIMKLVMPPSMGRMEIIHGIK